MPSHWHEVLKLQVIPNLDANYARLLVSRAAVCGEFIKCLLWFEWNVIDVGIVIDAFDNDTWNENKWSVDEFGLNVVVWDDDGLDKQ